MKAALQTQAQAQAQTTPSFKPLHLGLLQRTCACGGAPGAKGECEECNEQRVSLHRKAQSPELENRNTAGVPSLVHEVLRSSGQPLNRDTRAFMEPRFGHDFSRVRVHTGERAVESARAVDALAYTVGNDIVFGRARYAPETGEGRHILAHELTHVVQQASGTARSIATSMEISDPFDQSEVEGEAVADRITQGGAWSHVGTAASNVLQRLGDQTKVPTGLGCPVAATSPVSPVTNVFTFAQSAVALSALQIAELEDFVSAWHDAGASDRIRIDGYSSTDGADESNWTLSCQRAEAILAELTSPSSRTTPGIPASFIEEFAQGETDEFGATSAPNRRAEITSTLVLPPVSMAAPACPAGGVSTVMTAIVQPVRIAKNDGTNPTALPSFARLDIFRRCCVEVTVNAPITINNTALQILDDTGPGPLTAEENAAIAAGPAGTQINVMIIDNFSVGGVLTPNSRGGGTTVNAGTANPTVILVEGAVSEVVAHEVGHGLGHLVHTCPGTIMCPTGAPTTPNPEHVDPVICTGVRGGAALTATARSCCLNQT